MIKFIWESTLSRPHLNLFSMSVVISTASVITGFSIIPSKPLPPNMMSSVPLFFVFKNVFRSSLVSEIYTFVWNTAWDPKNVREPIDRTSVFLILGVDPAKSRPQVFLGHFGSLPDAKSKSQAPCHKHRDLRSSYWAGRHLIRVGNRQFRSGCHLR